MRDNHRFLICDKWWQRILLLLIAFHLSPITVDAARQRTHRRVELSDGTVLKVRRAPAVHRSLSRPVKNWNPDYVYRVPVILVEFKDCGFSTDDPKAFYERLFNEPDYGQHNGQGCVADYFRDQSGGLFNLQFDVVGPVKLEALQKVDSRTYGTSKFRSATQQADGLLDFSRYDWSGNGSVEQVLFVYAGYGGNETVEAAEGCIWPNTGWFSTLTLDGVRVDTYSASPELWSNNASCGIGTICHEFSHCLGLPDFYPTSSVSSEFSVLDEWDLMDGGNYADDGWCPPNYSAHEKEFLGWLTPTVLSSPATLTDIAAVSRGGETFKIVSDANEQEYYLLENRQQDGWDYMLPGHGLLITHVDYSSSDWSSNTVNTSRTHHRLEFFHADNMDYNAYDELFADVTPYGADGRSQILAHSAYPYVDADGISHDALTDETVPAAKLFTALADGSLLMGKPVSDIQETDGLVSFRFMGGQEAGVARISAPDARPAGYYDLQGRPRDGIKGGVTIVRYSDGTTKKIIR